MSRTDTSYKLSATLERHQADVRCVAASTSAVQEVLGKEVILTSSRDHKAILWSRSAPNEFRSITEFEHHNGFVGACLLMVHSGEAFAVTGGQDKLINAYRLISYGGEVKVDSAGEPSPFRTLIGHQDNICALDAEHSGEYLVSGSWDKTAKVWKDWECIATFTGHEQSVWAVLAIDHDRVLTASADRKICLWSISKPSKPLATFVGHTDAVRGLTLLAGHQSFASCSNDGNIHLYSLIDAPSSSSPIQPTQTLSGHTSFVYSLATIPGDGGELVSAGEDRSVRVWKDGNLLQTVTIPAISVWSVSVLPNTDVVCGSSDHMARVFTRDPSRAAEASMLEAYEHMISSQVLNQSQVGDIQKDKLPGPEALSQPGTKEGQTKMVKVGDLVEAHQWSSASNRWEKIGEVVGGVGSGQKKLYEGKEYDYVFDVDIADGVPPLKLPYNLSDNTYAAAQKFLEKNELSQEYIDQVVKFIETNTEGVSLGGAEYVDPYTGTNRYQPAGASTGATSQPKPAAPSTSSSSTYTGGRNVDPYTSSAPSKSTASSSILPQRNFLAFRSANFSAIKNKLSQINEQETTKLSSQEMEQIGQLTQQLEQAQPRTPLDVASLEKAVSSWLPASRLPALDLLRCAAAVGTTSATLDLARLAFEASSWSEDWPTAGSANAKARDVNSMLALRMIANLWNNPSSLGELEIHSVSLLGSLGDTHFSKLSKNGRIAFATVVYNATAQMAGSTSRSAASKITLDLATEILQFEGEESEVVYRALVALGNLICSSSGGSLSVGSMQKAKDLVRKHSSTSMGSEPRIASLCQELSQLM